MRRTVFIVVAALAAALLGNISYQLLRSDPVQMRSDFSIPDETGQLRSAASFDGQLVLLNFWAPWCAPCRAEIPMLNDLQTEYGPRGLQILGPTVDQVEAVQNFIQETAIDYPVLIDLPAVMRLQDSYGEQRLPFSVLIDRRGQVVFQHAGELERTQITALIEQYL